MVEGIVQLNPTCIVVARFRPQNKVELSSGGTPIVEFESEESCNINVSGVQEAVDQRLAC